MNKTANLYTLLAIILLSLSGFNSKAQLCGFFNAYGDDHINSVTASDYDPINDEFYLLGTYDIRNAVVKLDGNGNVLWTREIPTTLRARSIVYADGGGAIIACDESSDPYGVTAIFVYRLDNSGAFQWLRKIDVSLTRDRDPVIVRGKNGSNNIDEYFIMFGQTVSGTAENLVMTKISGNGTALFTREYAINGDDQFYHHIEDGNGGVISTGGIHNFGRYAAIFHFNSNGGVLNAKKYEGSNTKFVEFYKITPHPLGGFYTIGEYTVSTNLSVVSYFIVHRLDANLKLLWNRRINTDPISDDALVPSKNYDKIGLATDDVGNVYVSFKSKLQGAFTSQVVKIDENGGYIWAKHFNDLSNIKMYDDESSTNSTLIFYGNYDSYYGQSDIFFSRSNNELNSCLVKENTLTLSAMNFQVPINATPSNSIITPSFTIETPHLLTVKNYNAVTLCNSTNCGLVAGFNARISCFSEPVHFTSTSYDPAGGNLTYQWNFGDMGTSSAMNPSHNYASGGLYTVELIVSNDDCPPCIDTFSTEIFVADYCNAIPCDNCIPEYAPQPGKKYIISAWAKQEGVPLDKITYTAPTVTIVFPSIGQDEGPFKPSGQIIDGWQRIEEEFLIPAGATDIKIQLSSDSDNSDVYFDDIRIFPFDGNMTSYVYDPVNLRLHAELDSRNYATFYEYDEEGKLVRVKKETERGIMTIQETKSHIIKQ